MPLQPFNYKVESRFYFKNAADSSVKELTDNMLIGRSEECDFRLTDEKVSGKHARISIRVDVVLIRDLNSTNKTVVNTREITPNKDVQLNPGDKIIIGKSTFFFSNVPEFEITPESLEPPPPPSPANSPAPAPSTNIRNYLEDKSPAGKARMLDFGGSELNLNLEVDVASSRLASNNLTIGEMSPAAIHQEAKKQTEYLQGLKSQESELNELISAIEKMMQQYLGFKKELEDTKSILVLKEDEFAKAERQLEEINRIRAKLEPQIKAFLKCKELTDICLDLKNRIREHKVSDPVLRKEQLVKEIEQTEAYIHTLNKEYENSQQKIKNQKIREKLELKTKAEDEKKRIQEEIQALEKKLKEMKT